MLLGVDAYFNNLEGVIETETGYANGNSKETYYENLKNQIMQKL